MYNLSSSDRYTDFSTLAHLDLSCTPLVHCLGHGCRREASSLQLFPHVRSASSFFFFNSAFGSSLSFLCVYHQVLHISGVKPGVIDDSRATCVRSEL